MARVFNQDTSGWATSGTATAGTTGFSAVQAGQWTHVIPDVAPPGGVQRAIEGPTGVNATFQLQDSSHPFNGSTYYGIKFSLRAVTVDRTALVDGPNNPANRILNLDNSYFVNLNGSVLNRYSDGAVADKAWQLSQTGLTTVALYDGTASFYQDQWVDVLIFVRRHASGFFNIGLNGTLVVAAAAVDLSAATMTNWTITMQANAGVKFQIGGPIEAWDGLDITSPRRMHCWPSNSAVQTLFMPGPVDTPAVCKGGFAITNLSGTPTTAIQKYATTGVHANRQYYGVHNGSSTDSVQLETQDSVGTLNYNDYGWINFVFPHLFVDTGKIDLVLRNFANNADLYKVTFTGVAGVGSASVGGVTFCNFYTKNSLNTTLPYKDMRSAVVLQMHSDGRMRLVVWGMGLNDIAGAGGWVDAGPDGIDDDTGADGSYKNAVVVDLPRCVTPVTQVGKIRQVLTLTSTIASDIQLAICVDGVAVCKQVMLCAIDSLTSASENMPGTGGVGNHTGGMNMHNHYSLFFQGTPGSIVATMTAPANTDINRFTGLSLFPLPFWAAGISGMTRNTWNKLYLPVLRKMGEGTAMWVNLDGGSINDIHNSINTMADVPTVIGQLADDLERGIHACLGQKHHVWLTTMTLRTSTTSYAGSATSTQAAARAEGARQFNLYIRNFANKYGDGVRLLFSDIASVVSEATQDSWIDTSNAPHPTVAGSKAYVDNMQNTRRVMPVGGSGSGSGAAGLRYRRMA